MTMATEVPRWRRWAASGALGSILVAMLHEIYWHSFDVELIALLAGFGAAALGLSRRSVMAQVFSRGVAWLVFAPTMIGFLFILLGWNRFELSIAGLAAASGASLLLARPVLHTKSAHSEFGPVAYRRIFLAGAVSSVAAFVMSALLALDSGWNHAGRAFALAGISFGLIASAVGVLRMRGWGVFLAGLTSFASLVAASVTIGAPESIFFAMAAFPGLVLVLPVLLAQIGRDRRTAPALAAPMRVAETRYRVAAGEADVDDSTEEDAAVGTARATVHAER
jgi:hypothetical protein